MKEESQKGQTARDRLNSVHVWSVLYQGQIHLMRNFQVPARVNMT